MTLNLDTLKANLETKINALDNTASSQDIISLSLALDQLTEDRIVSVDTENDLPDLQTEIGSFTLPSGSIFYVKSLGVLVISCKAQWVGLDGRLLRDDAVNLLAYSWGRNDKGQLGDGTTTSKSSPVSIIGNISWSSIETRNLMSFGISSGGIAYAWGENLYGQIGDGTTISKSSPVTVIGGIANWKQLSGSKSNNIHVLGVTENGIAYGWGINIDGRLGDGTTVDKSSPVTVIGGITNWKQLSAGAYHSLGVTETGIAYSWGSGASGALGDNTTIQKSSPVMVVGGITNWRQVESSGPFAVSFGITETGIAYAWGNNTVGRLGDNTTVGKSSPVTVVGGITNWKQIGAGYFHTLGVTEDGIAYAWGQNSKGKLGDGTTINKSSPITVIGGITNWKQVSAGKESSLGLTESGIAYAWGASYLGELGDNTTVSKSSPVTVVGGFDTWYSISVDHSSIGLVSS